jgi:ferredoxin
VRNDLDSIVATCGGFCECATCHVHLSAIPYPVSPPTTALTGGRTLIKPPADLVPVLPEMTDEEEEQLEFAMGRKTTSRLSCQLPVTKELGEWCKKGGFIGLPQY